jgi:integrase
MALQGWAVAGVADDTALTDMEWARAYDLWLRDKAGNTRRAYERAWDDLCAFAEKAPAAILGADVQDWAEDLAARGLAAASISLQLSAISSFYRFACQRYLVRDGRGEGPLHGYNPAAAVPRPTVEAYAGAAFLDSRELAALLGAIGRDTVAGKRDYALFLGYVLTGRRNSEWRAIRWGDLRGRGARIYYTWRGKRTEHAVNELPPPVWEAIRDYLEAAGRLTAIGPDDFVFTSLSDRAARLPNVDGAACEGGHPLSAGEVNRLLRKYARRAGLGQRRVHVHVLRHSAAMLEEEVAAGTPGAGLAGISAFLGHADPKTTMRYLRHLRGDGDGTWARKCQVLGLNDGR